MTLSKMTVSKMTLSEMTLSKMTLSKTTLGIMTLRIMKPGVSFKNDTQYKNNARLRITTLSITIA